jgi:rhamnosyltransferase
MKAIRGTNSQTTTGKLMYNQTIGIALITHNAKHHLSKCLPPLLNSSLKPKVLVVNSSSTDGTVEEALRMGADTLVIPRAEFNHGLTRELARKTLGTDIVVMMTPDAYAVDNHVIEKLVAPLLKKKASVAYARQIPHDGAGLFESFPREFNYPTESHIRSIFDVTHYGIYTVFCSDTCAAYLNEALNEINGFQEVLTGEDTVAVAKLLHRGHRIAYVAEAIVKHSHHYSLLQEFRRHFDTGLARKTYENLLLFAGSDSTRGKEYVRALFAKIKNEKPWLMPYACLHVIAKWLGYRIGAASVNAPHWFKKALSSQDFYWK